MILEVIATNVDDAVQVAANGVDRIELVTAMTEGGLTPSCGMIKEVVSAVDIPVNVMIRPHSRSFHYNRNDVQTMLHDIRIVRELGGAGVVFGSLTEKKIDEEILGLLLAETGNLDVTFHRAFDEIKNQTEALETLLRYPQINRILTSGGQESVLDGVAQIKKLISMSDNTSLEIMAGNGLTIDELPYFTGQTGVKEVHFGTAVRSHGNPLECIDPEKVRKVVKYLQKK